MVQIHSPDQFYLPYIGVRPLALFLPQLLFVYQRGFLSRVSSRVAGLFKLRHAQGLGEGKVVSSDWRRKYRSIKHPLGALICFVGGEADPEG